MTGVIRRILVLLMEVMDRDGCPCEACDSLRVHSIRWVRAKREFDPNEKEPMVMEIQAPTISRREVGV